MFNELRMLGSGQNIAAPPQRAVMERRWRPNTEAAPNCPRCDSTSTKFCYYNNYSLTQPRYFCKSCCRYWTKGGSLRNVPVGGGCRKNRRGKSIKVSNDLQPNSMDSTSLTSDNSTPSTNAGQFEGGTSSAKPPDIDLALVYEKYISQPPDDHQVIDFDQSQTAFSQLNSGDLLPEFPGQFASGFEVGIVHTKPDFDIIPSNNEVGDQLQKFCGQDAAGDFGGAELHELRGEECYGFAGFQSDLGVQDIVNPQIPSSIWQHEGIKGTLTEDQFGFCPDFSQNCWHSADFQNYESLYHI